MKFPSCLDYGNDLKAIVRYQVYLDFFKNSFVELGRKDDKSAYNVKDGKVTFVEGENDPGYPILHDMGHFVLAPINKLIYSDWGFDNTKDLLPHQWYDLNLEVKVCGIERTLMDYYGLTVEPSEDSAVLLNGLQGWKNYRTFHDLNYEQMVEKVVAAANHWKKVYNISFFKQEWKFRNQHLRSIYG